MVAATCRVYLRDPIRIEFRESVDSRCRQLAQLKAELIMPTPACECRRQALKRA